MARRRRAASATGEDLLALLLLRARDPDTAGDSALDDDEIRDQVLVFLLAGHETTAIALTLTLSLLRRHPEAQQHLLGADGRAPSRSPR